MSKKSLFAVGAGVASAILYISVMTGSPGAFVLAYLTQLPLFLVGLGLGLSPAVIAGAVGAAVVLILGSQASTGLYLILMAAPVVILVRHALLSRPAPSGAPEWYPAGLLVSWLIGMALVFLVGAAVFLVDGEAGVEGAVRDYIRNLMRTIGLIDEESQRERFVETLAEVFLAAVMSSWCLMVAVNGVLAQGLLMRFKGNLRPAPRIDEIVLPRWPGYVLIIAAAASFVSGDLGTVGRNAAIILCLPFFFLGLGVVHFLIRRFAVRMFLLVLLYLMVILLGWPALIVAGIGLIEHFAGLRRRLAGPRHGQENE